MFKSWLNFNSIKFKLVLVFLLVAIIPIFVLGILSYDASKATIKETVSKQLYSVVTLKKSEIITFLQSRISELDVLSKSGDVKNAYSKLKKYHDSGGIKADGSLDVTSAKYQAIYNDIYPFFNVFTSTFHYYDLFMLCEQHGHVMFSHAREADLGTSLSTGPYQNSNLAELWREVIRTKQITMVDYAHYEPSKESAIFIGAPVFNENNEVISVIALQISTDELDKIMQQRAGFGQTDESYLVGEDRLMRSDSRFSDESTILNRKVDTKSVDFAFQNKSGSHIITDYRGEKVESYYMPVKLDKTFNTDFDWAIISEVDIDEIFVPIFNLRDQIILIGLIIAVLVVITAFAFAGSISNPIIKLKKVADKMALGDLRETIEVKTNDEIGKLSIAFEIMQNSLKKESNYAKEIAAGNLTIEVEPLSENDEMGNAFKLMVNQLRKQMKDITEGISVLASSSSEIMASVSQLASSTSESSTSIGETTVTVEEVRQTAELASEKAKSVSDTSNKNLQVAQEGNLAIEDTINGMSKIKQQMEQIANMVVKLSEQSQTISSITESVNEIAEQSNLLAVNAAIEAAKAGEHGKGFSVVAQEIKNLSERSKEATTQVQSILREVQQSISKAVMVTEEGSKVVDEGLTLTAKAGDTIQTLADNISQATDAAIQIAASSQQQLEGMDQITVAMENVKESSMQVSTGTQQAADSAKDLQKLGEKLQDLVSKYQVD